MMNVVNFIMANYPVLISSIVAILGGLIGIFMLIPGDQPEKTMQAIVDFLKKYSQK